MLEKISYEKGYLKPLTVLGGSHAFYGTISYFKELELEFYFVILCNFLIFL